MGSQIRNGYTRQLCRKRPSRKDIWHLDEVVISIGGRKHWLWRAVDQEGYVLDEIVQPAAIPKPPGDCWSGC